MVKARGDLQPASRSGAVADWYASEAPVDYAAAVAAMDARANAIAASARSELVWLLEHPPLYTAGTSASADDVAAARFPIFSSGRGGQLTYHGPGQRVGYLMLDLRQRGADVRRYVAALEEWLIRTLSRFNIRGERREDRVGVWVRRPDKGEGFEDKIAAIGVRVRHWVTLHGVSLNVDPDLSHFDAIVPCGISDPRFGVTSLVDLGLPVGMAETDAALRSAFSEVFGETRMLDRPPTELAAFATVHPSAA